MASATTDSELEKRKMELIKLRIQNKYYEKEDVLEKVVHEIIHKNIQPRN